MSWKREEHRRFHIRYSALVPKVNPDPQGKVINYGSNSVSTWEQICEQSSKVVTLMDTAGHPKYQRTTIGGLTGNEPHYAGLVFSANVGGVPEVSKEHFKLCLMLKVPCFIVITKIDIASPDQLTKTIQELLNFLNAPGIKRVPVIIQNKDNLISAVPKLATSRLVNA
jgi:GTPase